MTVTATADGHGVDVGVLASTTAWDDGAPTSFDAASTVRRVTVTDEVSETTLTAPEGGSATYTVRLTLTQPPPTW